MKRSVERIQWKGKDTKRIHHMGILANDMGDEEINQMARVTRYHG